MIFRRSGFRQLAPHSELYLNRISVEDLSKPSNVHSWAGLGTRVRTMGL